MVRGGTEGAVPHASIGVSPSPGTVPAASLPAGAAGPGAAAGGGGGRGACRESARFTPAGEAGSAPAFRVHPDGSGGEHRSRGSTAAPTRCQPPRPCCSQPRGVSPLFFSPQTTIFPLLLLNSKNAQHRSLLTPGRSTKPRWCCVSSPSGCTGQESAHPWTHT